MILWQKHIEYKGVKMNKRDFILSNFVIDDFIEKVNGNVILEETESLGKSKLDIKLPNEKQFLCIKNVDSGQKTDIAFFKTDKDLSLKKRVDHIIFEEVEDNQWNAHLIEMKTSVGVKTWTDIKGKFRASYLMVQGIAAMLEMQLAHIYMYTTYETEFLSAGTMPVERRVRTGGVPPKKEWESGKVQLNFGEILRVDHEKIQMSRQGNELVGTACLGKGNCRVRN